MDTRIIKLFAGFAFGTIVAGIVTNAIVSEIYSSDGAVSIFLRCPIGDTTCAVTHLMLITLAFAILLVLISVIINIVWWKNLLNKITIEAIPTPTRYSAGISLQITNNNKHDLVDFLINPIQIKVVNWPSSLNTIGDVERYSFSTKKNRIRARGKVVEGLAEASGSETDGYLTKFLVEEGGYLQRIFFTVDKTDKSSSDAEKTHGDLYGAIYEVVLEVCGKIGEGQISKIFKGKFYHLITVDKWKRRKRGRGYSWTECPPTYCSNVEWIEFKPYSMKEHLRACEETQRKQKMTQSTKGEILTRDDFINTLFNERERGGVSANSSFVVKKAKVAQKPIR